MIKKTFTSTDLDGKPFEETYYFNISKYELMRVAFDLGIDENGDLDFAKDYTPEQIAEATSMVFLADKVDDIMDSFEKIISAAVGRKSDDGKHLVKDGVWDEFRSSSAYSDLIFSFLEDKDGMSGFMNAVLGPDVKSALAETNQEALPKN